MTLSRRTFLTGAGAVVASTALPATALPSSIRLAGPALAIPPVSAIGPDPRALFLQEFSRMVAEAYDSLEVFYPRPPIPSTETPLP